MLRTESRRVVKWLWAGISLDLAGLLLDQRWHASHDIEQAFESWGNQAEAHWLLWIGTAATLTEAVLAFLGLRRVLTGSIGGGGIISVGAGAVR